MIIEESKIKKDFFLSICIPTFNRCDKTFGLVKNILSYKGDDIEVVVLDNCSTDNTQSLLNKIKDVRFVYVRNEFNIGSMPNVLKSLTLGTGKFVMLCLDKDWILSENLSYLIERIIVDKDVVVGQCALNSCVFDEDVAFDQGLSALMNLSYTSEHPSGLFMKRDVLINANIIDKIINSNKIFAFNTELVKAELSVLGKAKRINIPIVCTETLAACEKEMSHTYKGDNIYFVPKNIINTFNVYCENLFNLNISKKDKIIVLKRIFLSLLNASTLGFKEIMKNKSICMHHGINTRNVGLSELIRIDYLFSKAFVNSNLSIGIFAEFYICILANMKIVYIVARSKFKK